MIYINNEDKLNFVKFSNPDDFYIVADFDKTLTDGNIISTWGVLSESGQLGEEYKQRRRALYNYYRPIEIDANLSDTKKSNAMSEWWQKHINLFYEYGLTEAHIDSAIQSGLLKYRKGMKELLQNMKKLDVPVIIISAGIGNVIEKFLKYENDYSDNIKIISNFIKFNNGIIEGLIGETIHSFSKNIIKLDEKSQKNIEKRNNILLLGDGLADLKMIPDEDKKRAITVGFLDEKIEENLEYFKKAFDIVLTDGGTFDDVNDILNIY